MSDGFRNIIAQLEKQRAAIERALAALREVEGPVGAPPATNSGRARAKSNRGLTPEGRKRLAEAMKRRWAAKRTASQARKKSR